MPITPTNLSKHTVTPSSTRKGGYAFWDDSEVTWDSAIYLWDSPIATFTTNLSKHTVTPTNQTKH
jgi:hypothetical protein